MTQSETYYRRLGVPYNADTTLIRQAYRSLARLYHPDHNPSNPEAEDRFKAINEAYQVLSDPQKRTLYNQYGEEWYQYAAVAVSSAEEYTSPLREPFAWDESTRTVDSFIPSPPSGEEMPSVESRVRHMHVSVRITLEEAFHGTIRTYHEGAAQVNVTIPPGVKTGTRLCVPGAGGPGDDITPPGDLFLDIVVLPHETFARRDDDLRICLPVHPELSARGGSISVPTLAQPIYLNIPPNTPTGTLFRLKGLGMPHLYLPDQRGDLYVQVVN
ncbi:MAG: J domain-containing protein [Caldilineaceae bacterium]|nr:J domain-containing protein [Caldilineaceae bacterium]